MRHRFGYPNAGYWKRELLHLQSVLIEYIITNVNTKVRKGTE